MYTDYNDASSDEELARNKECADKIRNLVPKGPSEVEVCECGEKIPEPRRLAGYSNCVICQQDLENRKRFFR